MTDLIEAIGKELAQALEANARKDAKFHQDLRVHPEEVNGHNGMALR